MLRGLIHYGRLQLAVLVGAAVATAVLTGALLVGDSVRGSLRALTLDRLGRVDRALVAERFFRASLATDLDVHAGFVTAFDDVAPAIALRGTARHADSGRRAAGITLWGIDGRFATLHGDTAALDLERAEGQLFPSVVLNTSLARELGAAEGDAVVIDFGRPSEVARDSLMGDADPADVLGSLRVAVRRIVPDRGAGRFGLQPNQQRPLNAFVPLERLQRALGREDEVNALFLAARAGAPEPLDPAAALDAVATVEDRGFVLRRGDDHLVVESDAFILRRSQVETIEAAAAKSGAPAQAALTYLANRLRVADRTLPYSLVSAVDTRAAPPWAALGDAAGAPIGPLADDAIAFDSWTARELAAAPGDRVELEYFVVGPGEELTVERTELRLAAVVEIAGLAADPLLTPEYPGIRDAEDMAAWDPPFPVDLAAILPRDEAFWDSYGPKPKAFVSLAAGRRLWSTRYGDTTSVRVGRAAGLDLSATEQALRAALREALKPADAGLSFRAVRDEGLVASSGATEFSGLFIGFSLFLIASAAMLVALLFGLGVERRAAEIGLRLAVGYPLARVRRALLAEGAAVAAAGALVGLLAAVGYAALMMAALRTLWLAAVGTSELELHVSLRSFALGFAISMLVVLLSVRSTLGRLRHIPPPQLLAGVLQRTAGSSRPGWSRLLAVASLVAALGLVGWAAATATLDSPGLTIGAGTLLLVSGLAAFAWWCRGAAGGRVAGLVGMAARNSAWNPGRSILSVALVASASFVIVVVGANRSAHAPDVSALDSGSGGFELVAVADVPLHQSLASADGLRELGFDEDEIASLADLEAAALRRLPGDDASCLNLYRPQNPTLLGVPPALVERGAFRFKSHLELPEGETNPWRLLNAGPDPSGVLPAIGDANSVQWVLRLGLGDVFEMQDGTGQPLRLRIVGTMDNSVFQSELLIAEGDFLSRFPERSGYGAFLLDPPTAGAAAVTATLESRLAPFGFDVTSAAEKLASFEVVQNTYLSTFQLLGGLGLLLGTVGLGVVLLRNVLERRGELATLRAFGFRRARLGRLVLFETAFLLVVGMAIGSVAALVSVAPRLAVLDVPWGSLAATLGLVLAVGLLSCLFALRGALRVPLLPALKAER